MSGLITSCISALPFHFENFSCIRDTRPLLAMWCANVFSRCVARLFILFTWDFAEQKFLVFFYFNEVQFINGFFNEFHFRVKS